MPKAIKKFDPYERWRGLVMGRKLALGMTNDALAAKMGCGRVTVGRWLKEPDGIPLWGMRAIHRALDITAEDARAVLPMK